MDSSEERLIADTAQANRALGAGGQGESQISAGYAYLCRQAG